MSGVSPFIEGRREASESVDLWAVHNPSTGRRLMDIPCGSEADVNKAVASARRTFNDGRWRSLPLSIRKETLHRWADLIASASAELDQLDAEEMGKPISLARANAFAAAKLTRFYAEAIDKMSGEVYSSDEHAFVANRWMPRGVIGAIVPWNFPTYNTVLKAAPALAGGNSVILKPSEHASRSSLRLAELAVEAGLPMGVLNIVPGTGAVVGRALGLHMDVDMLSFTGSTRIGREMLHYSSQSNMKPVVAECGGKSPHIVFDDGVDVDAVAHCVADLLVTNQGQICSLGSRLLVQKSIETQFVARIKNRVREIVMGDARDRETTFGPMVSQRHCAKVMEYIDSAHVDGAELVSGGKRALETVGGYFIEPTIFRNVPSEARIAREEIFGPVLSIMTFDTEKQAIQLANSTIYGLLAYIWTAQMGRGMRMANGVRSSVLVNAVPPHSEGAGEAASVEPVAQSGIGTEGGLPGMQSYMRRQLLWMSHS